MSKDCWLAGRRSAPAIDAAGLVERLEKEFPKYYVFLEKEKECARRTGWTNAIHALKLLLSSLATESTASPQPAGNQGMVERLRVEPAPADPGPIEFYVRDRDEWKTLYAEAENARRKAVNLATAYKDWGNASKRLLEIWSIDGSDHETIGEVEAAEARISELTKETGK
jgi:hypothetical protein